MAHCKSASKGTFEMMMKMTRRRTIVMQGPRLDGLRASAIFSTTVAAVGMEYRQSRPVFGYGKDG